MLLGLAIIAAAAISAQGDGAFMSSGFVKALGVAASAVIGALGHKLWSRRVTIGDQPVGIKGEVERKPTYMTEQACEKRMCEMGARIDRVDDGQQKILAKLDEMDSRSEQRAIAAHNRIEPLVKELAKNIGQVELIKECFVKSTLGGKK